MATEAIGVLEQVVGGPAHIVGWSDGGNVGLLAAMRRPDLVDRMVVIGANFHFEGAMPIDVDPGFTDMIRAGYVERSPDGDEHFEAHIGKAMTMIETEPTLTADDLRKIDTPTLVLVGDDDLITLAHTVRALRVATGGSAGGRPRHLPHPADRAPRRDGADHPPLPRGRRPTNDVHADPASGRIGTFLIGPSSARVSAG